MSPPGDDGPLPHSFHSVSDLDFFQSASIILPQEILQSFVPVCLSLATGLRYDGSYWFAESARSGPSGGSPAWPARQLDRSHLALQPPPFPRGHPLAPVVFEAVVGLTLVLHSSVTLMCSLGAGGSVFPAGLDPSGPHSSSVLISFGWFGISLFSNFLSLIKEPLLL